MSKKTSFNTVVTRIKSEIRRRLNSGTRRVSAVDFSNVMRTRAEGSARGAMVRRAFLDLVLEGTLVPTAKSVYNTDTKHRVVVYRAR